MSSYKYVLSYGDREQLFHLVEDPQERRDLLYGDPDTGVLAVKERLKRRLLAYEKQWGLADMWSTMNSLKCHPM